VARRLDRLQAGNPGDFRSLGQGSGTASRHRAWIPGVFLTGVSRLYLSSAGVPRERRSPTSRGRGNGWKRQESRQAGETQGCEARPRSLYDEWAHLALTSDPELAQEYLRQTLEESADGGRTVDRSATDCGSAGACREWLRLLASAAKVSTALLSAAGNPRLSTLLAILRCRGPAPVHSSGG